MATLANVASSATSVALFADDTDAYAAVDLLGRTVFNDSTPILYVIRDNGVGDQLHGADRGGGLLRVSPAAVHREVDGIWARPTATRDDEPGDRMPLYNPSGSGGGSGTVTSVTAADTSIVVSGTDTVAPEIATATLDVIATQHPPAASVPITPRSSPASRAGPRPGIRLRTGSSGVPPSRRRPRSTRPGRRPQRSPMPSRPAWRYRRHHVRCDRDGLP